MEAAIPSLPLLARGVVAVALLSGSLVTGTQAPAHAGCTTVENVTTSQGAIHVITTEVCTHDEAPLDPLAEIYAHATETLELQACLVTVAELGLAEAFCFLPESEDLPGITPDVVAAALRRVPLPPSELIVQPPNGRTLVNFDTNFYTETAPLDRTIRLFGQQVDLRIWPSSYEWHFGDGATTATESAGSPYPDLEITHSYTAEGRVGPAVDTTYSAEFRVNGGAWRPVPGTVTIPGAAVALEVVEATPVLVGYS